MNGKIGIMPNIFIDYKEKFSTIQRTALTCV